MLTYTVECDHKNRPENVSVMTETGKWLATISFGIPASLSERVLVTLAPCVTDINLVEAVPHAFALYESAWAAYRRAKKEVE